MTDKADTVQTVRGAEQQTAEVRVGGMSWFVKDCDEPLLCPSVGMHW